MAALDHTRLIKAQVPTGPAQVGISVPAAKKWYMKEVWLVNTHSSAVTGTLYLGTAATTPNIVYNFALDAGESLPVPLEYPWIAEASEALFGAASVNNVVNIIVYGAEQ